MDSGLVIVEAPVVPTRANADQGWPPFTLEGVHYDDESMAPIEIEVREPRTGVEMRLTVIGVLDNIHAADEDLQGMFVSKSAVDAAVPFPIPLTTYLFRLRDGADPGLTAKAVEAAFLEYGMEAEGLVERVNRGILAFKIFIRIFVGFMGLGLVVGVAALGVVSTRAVVERRQQIGVLRAIGYKRRMIQMSFLLESSFVSLLGTIIGVVLGLKLSYNAINDIRAQEATDTLRFTVPWMQIAAIVAVTYVFSLLTTYLPARQASRIYPAEALRYE